MHFELSTAAMSNRTCLLSKKLCHYLNQGRTLKDIRGPHFHWFDLILVN